jgi:hypothetical protein
MSHVSLFITYSCKYEVCNQVCCQQTFQDESSSYIPANTKSVVINSPLLLLLLLLLLDILYSEATHLQARRRTLATPSPQTAKTLSTKRHLKNVREKNRSTCVHTWQKSSRRAPATPRPHTVMSLWHVSRRTCALRERRNSITSVVAAPLHVNMYTY